MVHTKCHKTSSSFIVKIEMRNRVIESLWVLIFPIAAFALGFYYNNAFYYIGLMLILLLYPFLLTITYLNTLLLPGYTSSLKPRSVKFDDNSLEITYVKIDENGIETPTGKPVVFKYVEISSFEVIKEHFVIKLNNKKALIVVPFDSFYSTEDITKITQILNQKLNT